MIIVYTGNGKGKTTAALGMVFRALGRQQKVAMVQYIKGKWVTGEGLFARDLPGLSWDTMGEGFTWEKKDPDMDRRAAQAAWQRSMDLLRRNEHAIVVLDEFTYPVNYGFLDKEEVVRVLDELPEGMTLVVTGRDCPEEILQRADLVTEMKKVRHPFDAGKKAVIGVDY